MVIENVTIDRETTGVFTVTFTVGKEKLYAVMAALAKYNSPQGNDLLRLLDQAHDTLRDEGTK